jgi:hypothetical protein
MRVATISHDKAKAHRSGQLEAAKGRRATSFRIRRLFFLALLLSTHPHLSVSISIQLSGDMVCCLTVRRLSIPAHTRNCPRGKPKKPENLLL